MDPLCIHKKQTKKIVFDYQHYCIHYSQPNKHTLVSFAFATLLDTLK